MQMLKRILIGLLTIIIGGHGNLFACTTICIKAQDDAFVCGRTMEWGTFDLHSRVAIVHRGHEFIANTPDGKPGLKWTSKYGAVALDILGKDYFSEGMNEKGLVVSSLFHPGFAQYQSYDLAHASSSMGIGYLVNYLLTQFATVEEVRQGIAKVRVVAIPEVALGGFPAPMHLMVTDQSGKSIAVEFLGGKLTIFENPLRVMTNAPSFDWHMTNIRNHINFSPSPLPPKEIEGVTFAPLGAGSGLLGLPGDYTPPSRFVRAVVFSQIARKAPDTTEAVYEMFRILDSFNLPLVAAEGANANLLKGMRSSTIWTSAVDTKNLILYYHTQHNRRVRMVDLKRINFAQDAGIVHIQMDKQKVQDIEDVTPM
ncbi:MAG: linear amide C-N hydrolase [Deltaproteobacteria bacterium]|nr:linear amide C-N hydrolase [Deltaproteobacteria bacterium]